MKALFAWACFALVGSCAAEAADFEIEFTEQTLNRLVGELGNPSAGGMHQPAGLFKALGLSGCKPLGGFACSSGTSLNDRPSTQMSISVCNGGNGLPVVVPGVEPVLWQWWITDAHFTVIAQNLTFTAKLRYRIGSKWFQVTQTVPASLTVDLLSRQLRLAVSSFKVPINHNSNGVIETLADVDVARYMSFTVPISAQSVAGRDFLGNDRNLTGGMANATVQYLPGKILVAVDGNVD